MMVKKISLKDDDKNDKAAGIKPGSKKDIVIDKKTLSKSDYKKDQAEDKAMKKKK